MISDLLMLFRLLGKKKIKILAWIALSGVVVGFLEMTMVMMVPILIKFLSHDRELFDCIEKVKEFFGGFPLDNINYFLTIFLILFTIKFLVSLLYYRSHSAFLQKAHFEIVNNLFSRLTGLSYLEYKDQSLAENLKMVTLDNYELTQRVLVPTLVIITETITVGFLLLLIYFYNSKFFLIAAIILGSIFFGYKKLVRNPIQKSGMEKSYADTKMVETVQDYVSLYKEIKLSGNDEQFRNIFENFNDISSKSFQRLHFFNQVPRLLLEYIGVLAIVGGVIFTLDFQSADFLPFISLVVIVAFRLLPLVNRITNSLNDLSFGRGVISSFYFEGLMTDKKIKKRIEFRSLICEGLSISIDGRKVIKELNFSIIKNDIVAIIGRSGVGKTTLIDFIMGFIPKSSGQIIVNGDQKYDVSDLRHYIRYVPQDTYIVNGSISQNISLFAHERTYDSSRTDFLIDKLNLHSLRDRMKEGSLGDSGKKISGGEKQRIGIARAIYDLPQILILDEATSHLDKLNQKIVLDFLKELSKSLTIIFITHRHETLPFANKTIELCNEESIDSRE